MMKKTAIVILNWNGQKLLEQFLPALLKYTPETDADIFVADNDSSDDSIDFLQEHYPSVKLILLDKNYGFAEGYNQALKGLEYDYFVLLNSDVEVTEGWFAQAINYLDQHPEAVALQPKILSYKDKDYFEYAGASGGFIDKYGYPFCRGRIFDTIEKDNKQYNKTIPVFWVSGACFFIRSKDFQETGGFDKEFFAHQEEIDLCWRLNARGGELVCYPDSVVSHVGGATLDQSSPQKTYLNFRNNLLMLYKNLPEKELRKTLRKRFFLDYLAAFHFLLKGETKNAQIIRKARKDFKQMKKEYEPIRQENLTKTTVEHPLGMLQSSLLWNYYVNKKKTFGEIYK